MLKGMLIKERPEYHSKGSVMTFGPNTTVDEAAKQMSEKNYGSCVVLGKGDSLEGIVTERDFMRRVIAEDLVPHDTKLKDIMTKEVKTAQPEDRVVDWMRQMSNERFRHVPVVDEEGKVVNIMSQGDFVSYTWPELHMGKGYQLYFMVAAFMIYTLAIIGIFIAL